jgi:hypothetical protein
MIPPPVSLGTPQTSLMSFAVHGSEDVVPDRGLVTDPDYFHHVLGWPLPDYQRGFVWSEAQQVKLIESIWRGIPIGYWAVVYDYGSPLDGLLIDGQQRLTTIERYLSGMFPVYGAYWGSLSLNYQRRFMKTFFPHYAIKGATSEEVKEYYNLLNFGGTPHI